jgi:hypothetical protein
MRKRVMKLLLSGAQVVVRYNYATTVAKKFMSQQQASCQTFS